MSDYQHNGRCPRCGTVYPYTNKHDAVDCLLVLVKQLDDLRQELEELQTVIAENKAHQDTWDKLQDIGQQQVQLLIKMLDDERVRHEETKRELDRYHPSNSEHQCNAIGCEIAFSRRKLGDGNE